MRVYNAASDVHHPQKGHRLEQIPAHDPFVLTDEQSRMYYLYTGGSPEWNGMDRYGVLVYRSTDLLEWEGPSIVFTVPDGIWAHPQHGAWAPEVHKYEGRYYLFVTLHNEDRPLAGEPVHGYSRHWRGTVIAVSDSPEGPFEIMQKDAPVLPETMMTLDGTLYRDEEGAPWMVYCHEWIQTTDGTIEAIRLTEDLSAAVGEPAHLFSASAASWIQESISSTAAAAEARIPPVDGETAVYVSDGCQLYRTSGGQLVMLWSSYEADSYVQTQARSLSGRLEGPWEQLEPLVREDSGHGMLFRTLTGSWMLIVHRPFRMPDSRCILYEMEDTGDLFRVKG